MLLHDKVSFGPTLEVFLVIYLQKKVQKSSLSLARAFGAHGPKFDTLYLGYTPEKTRLSA